MPKARNTGVAGGSNEIPNSEGNASEEAPKLSNRDALEVALEATRGADTETSLSGVGVGVSAEGSRDGAPNLGDASEGEEGGIAEPPLEPPSEFTADEKADFLASPRKSQEAQLRLHRSRLRVLDEIKSGRQELADDKKLAESVRPFIKAMGVKEKPEVAIQKAIAMWHEFENGNPAAAAVAYLTAKGRKVPKELLEEAQGAHADGVNGATNGDGKVSLGKPDPLRERLESLEARIAREDQARAGAILHSEWSSFEQTKNAAGTPKFPDIGNSESGLRLASEIGSLVSGRTELSKEFVARAKARIPNLTYQVLLEEAYRYLGGRIDSSSEAPRSQETHSHLLKSRRAASSVPGRGAQHANGTTVKKYASRREALAAAVAELNQE